MKQWEDIIGTVMLLCLAVFTVTIGLGLYMTRTSVVEAQTLAVGTHANAWNNEAVLLNGVSNALDTNRCQSAYSSAFGTTGGAATLTVQYSQNGTTFYSSATNTGAVTGNFGISFAHGARYIRLSSNAAVTITATLACK